MCCSVCSSDSELAGHHVVVSVDLFPAHLNVCCRLWIVSDRIFVTNLTFSSAVANVLLSYASADARWFISCAQAECCLCAHREAHQRERRRGCLISASGVSCAHRASLISASGRVAKHLPTLVLLSNTNVRLSNTQRRLHANPFSQSFYHSLQHYPSFDQTSRWEENAGYQCKRHVLVEPEKTTKITETAFEKLEQKSIEPDPSKLNRKTRHQEKRTEHLHLNLPDSHLTPSAASPDPQTIYGHACMARSEMLL